MAKAEDEEEAHRREQDKQGEQDKQARQRREEKSQRTRSFLFVATGGVVSATTASTELEMYESGVGAINVPLLAGMEGSQATRSAHPSTRDRFSLMMMRSISLLIG